MPYIYLSVVAISHLPDNAVADQANFLRHTNRKVGRRKDLNKMNPSRDKFDKPKYSDRRFQYADRYSAQRIFQVLMTGGNSLDHRWSAEELLFLHNDMFPGQTEMTKGFLKKLLSFLEQDCVLDKTVQQKKGSLWSIRDPEEMDYIMIGNGDDDDDEPGL